MQRDVLCGVEAGSGKNPGGHDGGRQGENSFRYCTCLFVGDKLWKCNDQLRAACLFGGTGKEDNYCTLTPVNQFKKFAEGHYTLSSEYFPNREYQMLNACCDTFVVGSDQTWNHMSAEYYHYGNYFLLDFVAEDKKKAAYAASFGMASAAVPAEMGQKLYQRFQAISVREEFGVDICRDQYGVAAEVVLDPVFLPNPEVYDVLLSDTRKQEQEPYIAVYFLKEPVSGDSAGTGRDKNR